MSNILSIFHNPIVKEYGLDLQIFRSLWSYVSPVTPDGTISADRLVVLCTARDESDIDAMGKFS